MAEEEIFNNINEFAQKKSVIVISHRFATVKKAKKIIVIDKGEIIESGNHSQLVSNNSLYKEMYEKQKI